MKNIFYKVISFVAMSSILFVVNIGVVSALDDYTVLTPLPGTTKGNCTGTDCQTDFQTYLPGAFKLAIGIAAVLAFAMISYGGFQYMTTDSVFKASEGKKKVWDAVQGLILVIGAYTILYTINPQILNFNLSIVKPEITNQEIAIAGTTGPAGTTGGPSTLTHDQVRASLDSSQIQTQNPPCVGSQTTRCVTIAGLRQTTLDGLAGMRAVCPTCTIVLSGGTEGGHTAGSSHNNGTAVDILSNSNLDQTIRNLTPVPMSPTLTAQGCQMFRGTVGNVTGVFLYEPQGKTCGGIVSSGTHWHATFQ